MTHTAKKVSGKITSIAKKKGRSKGKITVMCCNDLKPVESALDDSVPVPNHKEFLRLGLGLRFGLEFGFRVRTHVAISNIRLIRLTCATCRDVEDDTWWCLVARRGTFGVLRQVMVLESRDRTPKTRAEKKAARGNVTRM